MLKKMFSETVGVSVLVTAYDKYNYELSYISAYFCLSVLPCCSPKTV